MSSIPCTLGKILLIATIFIQGLTMISIDFGITDKGKANGVYDKICHLNIYN